MSFDFYQGACNTFLEPNEKVVLCFNYVDSNDSKICHRSVNLEMFQFLNWILVLTEKIMKAWKVQRTLIVIHSLLEIIEERFLQLAVITLHIATEKLNCWTWQH